MTLVCGGTDTLTMVCHICGATIRCKDVECGELLPPWELERWHLAVARHIRKEHVR